VCKTSVRVLQAALNCRMLSEGRMIEWSNGVESSIMYQLINGVECSNGRIIQLWNCVALLVKWFLSDIYCSGPISRQEKRLPSLTLETEECHPCTR
jgi:hypothetical protein